MTVASTTARNDYVGAGATDTFAYGFRIFQNTDLLVTERDTNNVETTLVLTTDYTVAGVGDLSGGTITLTAGNLTTGHALTIRRVLPLTQNTDIRNQGSFFPETHEDEFDRGIMIDQQDKDERDRSIKLPETEAGSAAATILPVASVRANQGLGFDASGNPIPLAITSVGSPTNAQYVVLAVNANLTDERVLTGTTNQIVITDNGAGSTVVLSTPQNIHTGASPTFNALTITTDVGTATVTATGLVTAVGLETGAEAAPGSPNPGRIWLDSTTNGLTGRVNGVDQIFSGAIYAATADAGVANTLTELTIIGTGQGTLTLPANFLTVGKCLRARAWGTMTSLGAGPGNLFLDFYVGSTGFTTVDFSPLTNSFNVNWAYETLITVRTTGATGGISVGSAITAGDQGTFPVESDFNSNVATTIDTTASHVIDLTAQFSVASPSNTITCQGFILEVLR